MVVSVNSISPVESPHPHELFLPGEDAIMDHIGLLWFSSFGRMYDVSDAMVVPMARDLPGQARVKSSKGAEYFIYS